MTLLTQQHALAAKLRQGKAKNPYAVKKKIKKLKEKHRVNEWLSQ